jgi:hypothetical protein
MKNIGVPVLVVLIVLVVLAIGGGLFALLAYGVGMVLTRITGLEPLPATVISMVGMLFFGILLERTFNSVLSMPRSLSEDDEFDDFEEDDLNMDEDIELTEKNMDEIFAGVPRWRRPLKTLDFTDAKPDDRCPCGSGRKFKNCHGKKTRQMS